MESRNYLMSLIKYFPFFIGVNKVTLLGRVGADPQKRGNSENPVVTFPLATHTNYKYESGMYKRSNSKF